MSGICDTCMREHLCSLPIGEVLSCSYYRQSRWQKLFGTPERAARVIVALNNCRVTDCIDCWARGACRYYGCGDDYDALLEWLRGEGASE